MEKHEIRGTGPTQSAEHVRNIALDLVLTLLTLGLYNLWVQHKQMRAVNEMIRQKRYSFLKRFLLTLITLGLYHIYHEYRKSRDICAAEGNPESIEPIVSIVLCVFGLAIVADAVQQSSINRYYGSHAL